MRTRSLPTLFILLISIIGGVLWLLFSSPGRGQATSPGVDINPTEFNINEGDSASYEVKLTSEPTATVTVSISASPAGQVTVSATSLTFDSSNWSQSQPITVTAVDDNVAEDVHSATIQHSVASSDPNYDGIDASSVSVFISDNDTPGVQVTPTSLTVTEGGASDSYEVKLTSQPTATATVTVSISASPAGQVTVSATSLTFNSSNWNSPQTVTVTAVDDNVAEGDHSATIQHSVASSDPHYNNISASSVSVSISDNDTPGVQVTPTSLAVAEGGASDYQVVLASQPTDTVTITLSGYGSQLWPSPTALTFTQTDWDSPQTVTVTAVDDNVAEGDHSATIQHSVASSDPHYNNISANSVFVFITDNDTPGVQVTPTSLAVAEGGASDYQVVLTSQPTDDVTITLSGYDSQLSPSPTSLTFTMANWNTPQTVTVTAVDDNVAEGDHSATIQHSVASSDPHYNNISASSVSVSISDNDSTSAHFWKSAETVNEGDSSLTVKIRLSNPTVQNVTVAYEVVGGTATETSDFGLPATRQVTIPAGQTEATFDLDVYEDNLDEPDETVILEITSVTGADLGTPNQITVTIEDNEDTSTVAFSQSAYYAGEQDGQVVITVTLDPPSASTVTVDFELQDLTATAGDDYNPPPTTQLTFLPGETVKTFQVEILDDPLDEGVEERVRLRLTGAQNATLDSEGKEAELVILDDDGEPGVRFQQDVFPVQEANTTVQVQVLLTNPSGQEVRVDYTISPGTATPGSDYVAPSSGTLVFDPGTTKASIPIAVLDDTLKEDNETALITLSNPQNALLTSLFTTTLFIQDNDALPTVQFDPTALTVPEPKGQATLTVTLSAPSGQTVYVNYATSDGSATRGSDYTEESGTLEFAPGETAKTFRVPVINDTLDEPDETINLRLTAPQNAVLGTADTATLTIDDDDPPPRVNFGQAVYETAENQGTLQVTVALDAPSGKLVQVSYATDNGTARAQTDYQAVNGVLTFSPGETEKTIEISLLDDTDLEGDEHFTISLSSPSNVSLGTVRQTTIVVHDNERGLFLPLVAYMPPPPIQNGGFEDGWLAWSHGGQLPQSLTSTQKHSGQRAALLGDPGLGSGLNGTIPAGSAWVEQAVHVPDSASATLRFWYRFVSYDVETGTTGILWDSMDVTVNGVLLYRVGNPNSHPGQLYDTGWVQTPPLDLSAFRGQTVTLRIAVWNREYDNNGLDYFNTWAYIDDVTVAP